MKFVTLKRGLANFRYHRTGRCNICGRLTIFGCTDLADARNNMACFFCISPSRKRHIAKLMLSSVFPGTPSISRVPNHSGLQIYNLDTDDAFEKIFQNNAGYFCSEYSNHAEPAGNTSIRKSTQDVERLTFQNEMFDVVISEDMFEHVRNYKKGFQEIFRVLKPGGYHIFTVPFMFDRPTLIRVDTDGPADIEILPPEYHGEKNGKKILAYRTFGLDLLDFLNNMGFETAVDFSKYADEKNGIFDSYAFISKKRL
jgi:SAM-dependent methyltransferase